MSSDEIVLKSGRSVYANNGYIGINADLELSQGYDGGVAIYESSFSDPLEPNELSLPDQIELGERMIGLWQAFIARATTAKDKE